MPASGLVDIHCHMVPCVDDGAVDIKEAVRMLKMERDQGVSFSERLPGSMTRACDYTWDVNFMRRRIWFRFSEQAESCRWQDPDMY